MDHHLLYMTDSPYKYFRWAGRDIDIVTSILNILLQRLWCCTKDCYVYPDCVYILDGLAMEILQYLCICAFKTVLFYIILRIKPWWLISHSKQFYCWPFRGGISVAVPFCFVCSVFVAVLFCDISLYHSYHIQGLGGCIPWLWHFLLGIPIFILLDILTLCVHYRVSCHRDSGTVYSF